MCYAIIGFLSSGGLIGAAMATIISNMVSKYRTYDLCI
jgi:hypothetical protein